jgi:hypothetical protein
VIINDFIRTRPLGTATTPNFIFDMADVFEPSRNSGTWAVLADVNQPTDWFHLSTVGATKSCTNLTAFLPTIGF